MDAVLRSVAIYVVLVVVFRLAGKRSLTQMTTLDFVLLLIVGEATQQALLGEDFSVTQAGIVIATLVGLDRLADFSSYRWKAFRRIQQSPPIILIQDGEQYRDAWAHESLTEDDIMEAARTSQGVENIGQIKHAVLESSGGISIIPRQG